MTRPDSGAIYLPSHQGLDSNLLIRTSTDPQTQVESLTRDLQSIDGNLSPVFQTMHSIMDHNGAFVVLRTVGFVFSAIGFLGLVLALVGIYSMVGYSVGRQTREIGIRMALGAGRSDVRRLVLQRSLRSIGAGIIAGVLIGVTLSLLLSKVFQGIVFMDIESLIEISILIGIAALIATYLPARRATNLDPTSALRSQ
jgi:ABC-type antimicrobial peptide transport system permease subunit